MPSSATTIRTPRPRVRSSSSRIQQARALAGLRLGKNLFHASDYFERLYDVWRRAGSAWARAYVDSLNEDEIRRVTGAPRHRARPAQSPSRSHGRENPGSSLPACAPASLPDGSCVLRAQDRHVRGQHEDAGPRCSTASSAPPTSHRGDACGIYPMYDFAHPLSDAIEGITHSLCTLDSSRTTATSTTGWSILWSHRCRSRSRRGRPSSPASTLTLHADEQAQAAGARRAQAGAGWDDPRAADSRGPAPPAGFTPAALTRLLRSDRRRPRPTARWT